MSQSQVTPAVDSIELHSSICFQNPSRSKVKQGKWTRRRFRTMVVWIRMHTMAVGLYFDVHAGGAICKQLRRRGVDVLTAQDDGADELLDDALLERATQQRRVLFTHDQRFRA